MYGVNFRILDHLLFVPDCGLQLTVCNFIFSGFCAECMECLVIIHADDHGIAFVIRASFSLKRSKFALNPTQLRLHIGYSRGFLQSKHSRIKLNLYKKTIQALPCRLKLPGVELGICFGSAKPFHRVTCIHTVQFGILTVNHPSLLDNMSFILGDEALFCSDVLLFLSELSNLSGVLDDCCDTLFTQLVFSKPNHCPRVYIRLISLYRVVQIVDSGLY